MPFISHFAALFVLMPETAPGVEIHDIRAYSQEVIESALNRLDPDHRRQVAGPLGGINGYWSVAILPSGGSAGLVKPDEIFDAVRGVLAELDPDVEVLRVSFGDDSGRTEVIETTDSVVWIPDGVPVPEDQRPSNEWAQSGVWVRMPNYVPWEVQQIFGRASRGVEVPQHDATLRRGDRMLLGVLTADDAIRENGLVAAVANSLTGEQISAAIEGLAYLDVAGAAAVLIEAVAASATSVSSEALDARYRAAIPSETTIYRSFVQKYRAVPDDFAPYEIR